MKNNANVFETFIGKEEGTTELKASRFTAFQKVIFWGTDLSFTISGIYHFPNIRRGLQNKVIVVLIGILLTL